MLGDTQKFVRKFETWLDLIIYKHSIYDKVNRYF